MTTYKLDLECQNQSNSSGNGLEEEDSEDTSLLCAGKENNDGFARTKDDGGKGGLCILRFGLCVV